MLLTLFIMAAAMIFLTGFYGLVVTRNLIRVVIAIDGAGQGRDAPHDTGRRDS